MAKTLPVPCVLTAFVAKTLPFLTVFQAAEHRAAGLRGPAPRDMYVLQQRFVLCLSMIACDRRGSVLCLPLRFHD